MNGHANDVQYCHETTVLWDFQSTVCEANSVRMTLEANYSLFDRVKDGELS